MMIKTILVVLGLTGCSIAGASAQSIIWPERSHSPMPDARINQYVEDARDAVSTAVAVADRAQKAASRLDDLDPALERYSEIVSEGVTFTGVTIDDGSTQSARLVGGTMAYPSGAIAKGVFAFLRYPSQSHWGDVVLTASAVSPIEKFVGEIDQPALARAYPKDGIMRLKNGDQFTGLFYTWGGASGIYQRADDSMAFIGMLDFNGYAFKFENGIVEDKDGKLVAIIRD